MQQNESSHKESKYTPHFKSIPLMKTDPSKANNHLVFLVIIQISSNLFKVSKKVLDYSCKCIFPCKTNHL